MRSWNQEWTFYQRTLHSERSTVTSILAGCRGIRQRRWGIPWLPWASSSSEEYVRTYKAVVRRLVGSFVKEGTSEGAREALDEAEAFEAVRDRLISTRDVSFDVQQQCERLKTVARQVLTALNQKPKTDNDKVSTIHMDPSTQVGLEEDNEGVKEGQEVGRFTVCFGIRCKTQSHNLALCRRVLSCAAASLQAVRTGHGKGPGTRFIHRGVPGLVA